MLSSTPWSFDLQFQDLKCIVPDGPRKWKRRRKTVLDGLNGCFKAGKLTAILGPSGAGKTSLLNALSGYRTEGVSGSLLVNGSPRNEQLFRDMSCYIFQDDVHQQCLTVREIMMFSAGLKLPSYISCHERLLTINKILATLGLSDCKDTMASNLSGGQQKRLSIACELINNPQFFFLDEPTSGLDDVAAKLCVSLLKTFAKQGRTVVCTIHQPSALLLSFFDNIYIVAAGKCIFQGTTGAILPFLKSAGIHCPTHYNPSDRIMEVVEERSNVHIMSDMVLNGLKVWTENGPEDASKALLINSSQEKLQVSTTVKPKKKESFEKCEFESPTQQEFQKMYQEGCGVSNSYWVQFSILLKRMLLQVSRNKVPLHLQLFHHVIFGFLIGRLFMNTAYDGSNLFIHVKFSASMVIFHSYTWIMVPVLILPSEVELLRREHFNKWYSLFPYYMAMIVSKIPAQVFFSTIFIMLTYFMSGLPLELQRFTYYACLGILISLVSEGIGMAIGSVFTLRNGSIVGPAVLSPCMGVMVFGFDFARQVPWVWKFIMNASYMRSGFIAYLIVVFGFDRQQLNCDDVYCHFKDPKFVLHTLDMDLPIFIPILRLCGILILFRLLCYVGLSWRLKR